MLDTRGMPARLQAAALRWLQLFRPAAGITLRVPDEPTPDAEVCRLLAAGERDRAFERLLAAYRGRVYRLALSYVRTPADAEDLAQEAFVRLWRALPLYDGRASFSTWLYVIARNACLSELRRRGARPTTSLDDDAVDPAAPTAAASPVDRRLECETLVEMLDEPQRRIVRLFYLEERSYEQVADDAGHADQHRAQPPAPRPQAAGRPDGAGRGRCSDDRLRPRRRRSSSGASTARRRRRTTPRWTPTSPPARRAPQLLEHETALDAALAARFAGAVPSAGLTAAVRTRIAAEKPSTSRRVDPDALNAAGLVFSLAGGGAAGGMVGRRRRAPRSASVGAALGGLSAAAGDVGGRGRVRRTGPDRLRRPAGRGARCEFRPA